MLQSLTMTLSKCLGLLIACLAISVPAWAANALTSLDVSTGANDSQVVKLAFKESLAGLPMHFATTNPSRIVLDFPGTDNALAERSAGALNNGILGSYRVVRANDRTRVVINLTNPGTYDLRKDDKMLYVAVQGAQQTGIAAPAQFAAKDTGRGHSIRDIDFRRAPNGAGRVEVSLSDPSVGIDIKPKGQTIQIDFLNTSLPNSLQRRLDVTEFSTPAQSIETLQQGKLTRMTIKPKGRWEYSAYQTGRQFIVEISPMDVDSAKQADKMATYSGEKLSLDFQGQDVRSVLKIIADFTNLNIIAADSVNGNVTLRLKDVPWDQALDLVLRTKGLDKRVSGNVIWVAPREELAAKEKLELEARKAAEDIEPLVTRNYRLNYVRADEAMLVISGGSRQSSNLDETASCTPSAEGVKSAASSGSSNNQNTTLTTQSGGGVSTTQTVSNRVLTNRGAASYDLTTNTLVITDILQRHQAVEDVLRSIDVPTKQVLIEARVVLADDAFGRTLGARLGIQGQGFNGNTLYGTASNMLNSARVATSGSVPIGNSTDVSYGNLANVDLGAATSGISNNNPASIGFTILNAASGVALGLELQALEADKRGKIVSNPKVVTTNLRPAVILQGEQIPVVTPGTSTTAPTTTFKDALLCLLVSPQVLNNDEVILNVEVTKDARGATYGENVAVNVKRLKTQVRVKNGETAVLGGIFEQTLRNDTSKVPLLGDLPILGNLFKNNSRIDDKSEMLVFLTPRLIGESSTPGRQ